MRTTWDEVWKYAGVGAVAWVLGSQAAPRETVRAGAPVAAPVSVSVDQAAAMMEQVGSVFARVTQQVAPSVVFIESRQRDRDGRVRSEDSGSGVVLRPGQGGADARPVVVTNLHVVGGARLEDIDVTLADGRSFHPRRVLPDRDTDLAVLEIPDELRDLPAARLADSRDVHLGQWVLVLGSPFGLQQSVTHGIVSATGRRHISLKGGTRIKEFIQTDAPINPGNSGGPLVNLRGEVVGINTAIVSKTDSNSGVGLAIPANLVRWVADGLADGGRVRRGYLGVGFPSAAEVDRLAKARRGAFVSQVQDGSPAAAAGIRRGDLIVRFDNLPIDDEAHLINVVSQTDLRRQVEILVVRDNGEVRVRATLGAKQEPVEPAKEE